MKICTNTTMSISLFESIAALSYCSSTKLYHSAKNTYISQAVRGLLQQLCGPRGQHHDQWHLLQVGHWSWPTERCSRQLLFHGVWGQVRTDLPGLDLGNLGVLFLFLRYAAGVGLYWSFSILRSVFPAIHVFLFFWSFRTKADKMPFDTFRLSGGYSILVFWVHLWHLAVHIQQPGWPWRNLPHSQCADHRLWSLDCLGKDQPESPEMQKVPPCPPRRPILKVGNLAYLEVQDIPSCFWEYIESGCTGKGGGNQTTMVWAKFHSRLFKTQSRPPDVWFFLL